MEEIGTKKNYFKLIFGRFKWNILTLYFNYKPLILKIFS